MILELKDVFTSEGNTQIRQVTLESESFSFGGRNFPVVEKSPVTLTLTNVKKGRAAVEGKAELALLMNCDRCLKDVEYRFSLAFEREVTLSDTGDRPEEGDDSFLDGYQLDVDALISNEIFLNWPMKVLCAPDCRGICTKCGRNLNDGACGCDTFIPDPRMAVIKDIFDTGKEV